MTIAEENELLWRTGHFRNPKFPDLFNVTKAQALALAEADPVRRFAVQSYQEFSERQLSALTMVAHGRECACDGDAGPATAVLFAQPRCMMPDFYVPDDPQIEPLWALEEANWPNECRNNLTFGRDFDALPGLSKADTDGVYWAMANNLTAALSDVDIKPDPDRDPSGARGWDSLEAMSGGTLAWNYLAQNNCGVRLKGAWNSNVRWDRQTAATTGTHEKMHWLGANHSPDANATIYYAITAASKQRYGYLNASDIAILRALGYKPHEDWQTRQPAGDKLFLPRGQEPTPPAPGPTPIPTGLNWPDNGYLRDGTRPVRFTIDGLGSGYLQKEASV